MECMDMWKMKTLRLVAAASTIMLLSGSCGWDGIWPWVIGAGVVGAGAIVLGT
jgi:hypothetical protein